MNVWQDPYLWAALVAAFVAAACAALTVRASRHQDPRRAAEGRWTFFFIWMAVALALATAAVLVLGVEPFTNEQPYISAAVVLVLLFLSFRFPRAGSISTLIIVSLIVAIGMLAVSGYRHASRHQLSFRVVAVQETSQPDAFGPDALAAEIRVTSPDALRATYDAAGSYLAVRATVLDMHPAVLVVRPSQRIRYEELLVFASAEASRAEPSASVRLSEQRDAGAALRLLRRLGLIEVREVTSNAVPVVLLSEYQLRFDVSRSAAPDLLRDPR